jgi:integrase
MLFVRSGELRGAEWDEIELDADEWRIPAVRMKMDQLVADGAHSSMTRSRGPRLSDIKFTPNERLCGLKSSI